MADTMKRLKASPGPVIEELRIEHLRETLGIGTDCPRISWKIGSPETNWEQEGFEIECSGMDGRRRETVKVESSQSVLVDWPFEPLRSREQVTLRVRVRDTLGNVSAWSRPLPVEAGLLCAGDWSARFISQPWDEDTSKPNPALYLRREFELSSGIWSARLYITALGTYEAQINGNAAGDHVLAPGWTVYDQRLLFQTFDVSALLKPGRNAIGAILADGWFRGRLGSGAGKRNIWGDRLGLLAQLEIRYEDGSGESIITDESWRAATGAILKSSIYDGETYDARLEHAGWTEAGFNETGWVHARTLDRDLNTLESPLCPPVRRIEEVRPVSITTSPSGKTIVDFGQNLVGRLSLRVEGPAGSTITLRHAEILENGEICTRPLRSAKATDSYTLRGGNTETWEPHFTFHGFRYTEVSGCPGKLRPDDISAIVIHSDIERTGWFECSDPMISRLHGNVVRSMRGNFLSVPTDCPQRDERLGWTGDIQVFSPTAAFLYDVSSFLQSWLADLSIEQKKLEGSVPAVVPNATGGGFGAGAAAWADAATVVPWVLYRRYGDTGILEDQFESMRAWVDHVAAVAGEKHLWDKGFQFGDWLDPTAPPDNPAQARTDRNIVACAYFVHSAELTARAAGVLLRTGEEKHYLSLAAEARAAFAREYITPAGRLMSDAETAYALALIFDLFPAAEQRQNAGNRLAELVRDSGYRIRTGFVGTPLICDALCSTGHHAAAYRLLTQRECPSWLYPVTMGATTIWERWDSMLPDGSVNPGEMTSFNHYSLGSVADWMHRVIGGLAPAEPGYRRIEIQPRPGGGLTYARTKHITPYGPAECSWKIENGKIDLDVVIPPNTTARVRLPGGSTQPVEVGSGKWHWSLPWQDPDARGPYTPDDLVGEIMSDEAARDAVLAILAKIKGMEFLPAVLNNEKSLTLRQALAMIPCSGDLLEALDGALTSLNKGERHIG